MLADNVRSASKICRRRQPCVQFAAAQQFSRFRGEADIRKPRLQNLDL